MTHSSLSPARRLPLRVSVANALRASIENGSYAPGDQLDSISALCEQFQTSNITIRSALNQLKQEGYVEGRRGSGVFVCDAADHTPPVNGATGATGANLIAFVSPLASGDNLFGAEMMHGVEEAAAALNFRVIFANSHNEADMEDQLLRELSNQVRGFVIAPVVGESHFHGYSSLLRAQVPWVFVDRHVAGLDAPFVTADNELGGYLATRHLLQNGCDRVAFLCSLQASSVEERIEGYKRALAEAGVAFDARWVRWNSARQQDSLLDVQNGTEAARQLLEEIEQEKTRYGQNWGLFTSNELLSRGAYIAARELSLRIPDDIAIVGYGDLAGVLFDPPLTTIIQDVRGMGARAARLLIARLSEKNSAKTRSTKVRLKPELVVRESSLALTTPGHEPVAAVARSEGALALP